VTRAGRRSPEACTGRQRDETVRARENRVSERTVLTLHQRSGGLEDNVRTLLDWLVDEELKRWQREER
jgi:hypothetical protein